MAHPHSADGLHPSTHLPTHLPIHSLILAVILAALALLVWLLLKDQTALFTPAGLRQAVEHLGHWGPMLYIGTLALSVVISPIPGAPLVVMGGVMWGPVAGVYAVVGGFAGGLIAYAIARTLGQAAVQKLTGRSLTLAAEGEDIGTGLVLVSRLLPVLPFGFLSYGWGMANVPARSYAIATLVGMTPPTLLLSYLGENFTAQASGTLVLTAVVLLLLVGLPLLRRGAPLNLQDLIQMRNTLPILVRFHD
ncbi:TVP38/TMEM64 family protein [Leptolyngbya sp. PCC 6406]|uniref:TVP38/TMEM64 family protein n=1 Tax=Leptolyngbya sp. PCC 6406 TaxID=1173264 RepID=UPI0002AC5E0A|nr:TVP38/TMEM64 family protein [Leptolyngbya sp. PCC 6406]